MMLIKEIAVYVNILNSRIKKGFFDKLQENGINITPEQYLVLDILWDQQSLSRKNRGRETVPGFLLKKEGSKCGWFARLWLLSREQFWECC